MILVVGATGMVGMEVCRRLAARGEAVRALVRPSSRPEKVAALRAAGVSIATGDLKDPHSLQGAVSGVHAIVSTASSTLSREAGDSIDSVDLAGQLNLIAVAKVAGVDRFVYVSFRDRTGIDYPLAAAKQRIEEAIRPFNYTVIRATNFMEVWLAPPLGFDYSNAKARIYGSGSNPVSWISFRDVAEFCVLALERPAAYHRVVEIGGPQAVSPLDVVAIFEEESGRDFQLERAPEETLRARALNATDPLEKTFACLMLNTAVGQPVEMRSVLNEFPLRLTSVREYARRVLGIAAITTAEY
jgi:uncharacterized protein YbjT (DUF2867 family)